MKNKISYCLFVPLLLIIFSSITLGAEIDCAFSLPTVKQNTCVNLIQTCSNCTGIVNLTTIYYPQSNGTVLYLGAQMTQHGNNYNYTFCDTQYIGTYIYSTEGSPSNILTTGNICFSVTPTGYDLSLQESIFFLILLFVFMFLLVFLIGKVYISSTLTLKSAYFSLAYIVGLLPVSYLIYVIASSYLLMLPFLSNVLYYFFFIILVLSPIIIFVCSGFMVYDQMNQATKQRLVSRGHSENEANSRIRRR